MLSSWSQLLRENADADFGISVCSVRDIPSPTAEDRKREKNPEAYERREMAKAWTEEQAEFNRLKNLAYAVGVKRVIVCESATTELLGLHIPCTGLDGGTKVQRKWGLSDTQVRAIDRCLENGGSVILINRPACYEEGLCRTFAHEIGHQILEPLASFHSAKERKASVTNTMRRLFPFHTHTDLPDRSEIYAECFAEYLTEPALKNGIKRQCDSILRRVRVHYPNLAKLIEDYRSGKELK